MSNPAYPVGIRSSLNSAKEANEYGYLEHCRSGYIFNLGSKMTTNTTLNSEINSRQDKAACSFGKLGSLENEDLSVYTRVSAYEACLKHSYLWSWMLANKQTPRINTECFPQKKSAFYNWQNMGRQNDNISPNRRHCHAGTIKLMRLGWACHVNIVPSTRVSHSLLRGALRKECDRQDDHGFTLKMFWNETDWLQFQPRSMDPGSLLPQRPMAVHDSLGTVTWSLTELWETKRKA